MKVAKVMGVLVGAAAIVLAVTIGFASAEGSSTTLCKVSTNSCSSENQYAAETEFASEGSVKISTSLGAINCENSQLNWGATQQTGSPLPTNAEWILENCARKKVFGGSESCAVKHTSGAIKNYGSLAANQFGGTGVMTTGSGSQIQWEILCGSPGEYFVQCSLGFESAEILVVGGNPAVLVPQSEMTVHSGPACPATVRFLGSYTVGSPGAVYVTRN